MLFDASSFKNRINKLIKELPLVVEKEMIKEGNFMHEDIVSLNLISKSESWRRTASQSWNHQPYFMAENNYIGLLDVIAQTKDSQVMVDYATNGVVSLGLGHIPTLDVLAPYWENFERTRTGESTSVRSHGSDEYGFVFSPGIGKRGEGVMKRVGENGKNPKPHPGVLGVNLFSDSYMFRKEEVISKVKESILDLINK